MFLRFFGLFNDNLILFCYCPLFIHSLPPPPPSNDDGGGGGTWSLAHQVICQGLSTHWTVDQSFTLTLFNEGQGVHTQPTHTL